MSQTLVFLAKYNNNKLLNKNTSIIN